MQYTSKVKMDDSKYSSLIVGDVIGSMRVIETIIDDFISKQYSDTEEKQLLLKYHILEQSLFSFELKQRILKKIFKENYSEYEYPKKLQRLQELRNFMAHGEILFLNPERLDIESAKIRHAGKFYEFSDISVEFAELRDEVIADFAKIPNFNISSVKSFVSHK